MGRLDRCLRRRAGLNATHDGKCLFCRLRQIAAAHRIAVDGGIGERRQRQRRGNVLGENAPIGRGQQDSLDVLYRADPRGDDRAGLIGPPNAKQSSDNCAILAAQVPGALRASRSSTDIADRRIIEAIAGMSSRWATGSAVSRSASVAMPTIPGSLGNSTALPLARRCTSILRCGSALNPSTITRSTGDSLASNSGSLGSEAPRNSCIKAHRWPEETSTSAAPDCRCTQESLPGTSTSKLWWACLMTETRRPWPRRWGMTRVNSVVLPAPLHPARPITFIIFSGLPAEPGYAVSKAAYIG